MIAWVAFILIAAFLWAKMEIEIEGPHGWAEKLPTWRVEKHLLLDLFYGGRPLTGYHVWAFSFVFFAFHLPFYWNAPWTWRNELRVIGAYDIFWVVEDFLWFVLNPHFGWRRFGRKEVWWHKRWLFGLPVDYWLLIALGAFFLSLSVTPETAPLPG